MPDFFQVEHLHAWYGDTPIVKDISFTSEKHSITTIIGESGCGKSTLLKSLNQIVIEENGRVEGKVILGQEDLFTLPLEDVRQKIGLVEQNSNMFPFSIEKNLDFVLKYHHSYTKEQRQEEMENVLRQVGLWEEVKDKLQKPATALSGGQKQRLAIARSLLMIPEVLLLDEPCSALDVANTAFLEDMLVNLQEKITLIIVTHNLAQAKRIGHQVIFMNQGQILEMSDNHSFFSAPGHHWLKNTLPTQIKELSYEIRNTRKRRPRDGYPYFRF